MLHPNIRLRNFSWATSSTSPRSLSLVFIINKFYVHTSSTHQLGMTLLLILLRIPVLPRITKPESSCLWSNIPMCNSLSPRRSSNPKPTLMPSRHSVLFSTAARTVLRTTFEMLSCLGLDHHFPVCSSPHRQPIQNKIENVTKCMN